MQFLKIKSLPTYRFSGTTAIIPDEYADRLGSDAIPAKAAKYRPILGLFDYQRDIAAMALRKRKYCVFADCGLGKTRILLEFARNVPGPVLIVSPLMVVNQTVYDECAPVYGKRLQPKILRASELPGWLERPSGIAITNYEAMVDDLPAGKIAGLILDESSMLKSHYGKWGAACLRLGRGVDWKLCLTGTPAPNDRIEYANHAVFMDAFPNVNSFLATFFVNRGQTDNRWEMKPHALRPFYRALSHWAIFLNHPATYGWKDNCDTIPPIKVHIHDISMTTAQQDEIFKLGSLFAVEAGGIGTRGKLAQIAKGRSRGKDIETLKFDYIRELVATWPNESTIIWCLYNHEQDQVERAFPDAASLRGETPYEARRDAIERFKSGKARVIISKPKVMGFGLNLQVATRQVFSGLQDSYESFYQCVKRSNRIGSKYPLNVHIPIVPIERPMIETVLAKANRVQRDAEEQERIFKDASDFR